MAGRFVKRHEVGVDDVERLMNCIVEHAGADEGREAERLRAMLTMLRATAVEHGEETIVFTPPRGTGALADRALGTMARSDKHAERAARHRPRRARSSADARRRFGDAAPRTAQ
jgi:hypothetical protein